MKHPLLAVLLLALFGAGFTALAAEPAGTPNLKDKARSAEPVGGKGVVIQGNQLKAMPGYVLKKGSNKRVLARPAGGGLGFDANCGCSGGTGDCNIALSGDVAICARSPSAPCSGSCGWTLGKMKMMK